MSAEARVFGKLLRWLKLRKAEAISPNPFPEDDPRHEAFEALWAYAQSRGRRRRRAPASELREIVLREQPEDLPPGSRDLLKRYREEWRHAPPEDWARITHRLPEGGRAPADQEAAWASAQIHEDQRRRGKKDPSHYYGASERTGAGEVDRTYDTRRPEEPVEGLGDAEEPSDQKS